MEFDLRLDNESKGYDIDLQIKMISRQGLLDNYRMKEYTGEACSLCPDYGKRWSCPPGLPDVEDYLHTYENAYIFMARVTYAEEVRQSIQNYEDADNYRKNSYELVKREMLLKLLDIEKKMNHAVVLGAGKCIICGECTRPAGKPCRFPDKRRYSITAFGFDFAKLLQGIFDTELLWSPDGLPEYDVAVAALFI